MTQPFVAVYDTPNHAIAFRKGVAVMYRKRDGHTCTLDRRETFDLSSMMTNHAPTGTGAMVIADELCGLYKDRMTPDKFTEYRCGVLLFHNKPVGEKQ